MTCPKVQVLSPLLNKTDDELVALIRNAADNDAFLEVCRRYENIFYKVCQKYAISLLRSGINPQDIFEEKNFIIFHCVSTFQPSKNTKLGTWIGTYARYLCLNSINSRRFILPTTDEEVKKHIEETQVTHDYFEHLNGNAEQVTYILSLLEQIKDKRIKEIFRLRYMSPTKMIWADIAKRIGVSTQTVINLHTRGITILRKKLKSKDFCDVI